MNPCVLKSLFPINDGIGLIELTRCVMFDIIDCEASWFSITYGERDMVKSPYVARNIRKWNQSVNRV